MSPSNHPFKRWLSPWLGTEPKVNLPKAFMGHDGQGKEVNCQQTPSSVSVCVRARTWETLPTVQSPIRRTPTQNLHKGLVPDSSLVGPSTGTRGGSGQRKRGGRKTAVKTEKTEVKNRTRERRLEIHRKEERKTGDI